MDDWGIDDNYTAKKLYYCASNVRRNIFTMSILRRKKKVDYLIMNLLVFHEKKIIFIDVRFLVMKIKGFVHNAFCTRLILLWVQYLLHGCHNLPRLTVPPNPISFTPDFVFEKKKKICSVIFMWHLEVGIISHVQDK